MRAHAISYKKKINKTKPTKQNPPTTGPMALEQNSVHSFLFISASNAALHRHFIFDFVILAKHSKQKHLQNSKKNY